MYYTLCIIITVYFQFINAYNDTITLEEVLKITNEYYQSYYCKNDICAKTTYDYSKSLY